MMLCGDYFINHEIRIPFLNNQDSMESKAVFFFVAHMNGLIWGISPFSVFQWLK